MNKQGKNLEVAQKGGAAGCKDHKNAAATTPDVVF